MKLNNIREFILQNYGDVKSLAGEIEAIQNDIDKLCEKICAEIKQKDWWSNDFDGPEYRWNGIFLWKKTWHFGKDRYDFIDLDVANIRLDNLMGLVVEKPNAGVWTKRLEKLGNNRKERFEENFKKISKQMKLEVPRSIDSEGSVICYNLPYNVDEWIKILKEGTFIDRILEHFDSLSQYIEPIDKALAIVRKTKR